MQVFKPKRNIYYSLLLTTFLFIISYSFFNVSYIESDDLEMLKIAKGYYSESPDEHLVYINVVVGFICKLLYGITQKIEWYSIVMILLQFLSINLIYHSILKAQSKKILIVFTSAAFFYFIINLQFTMVAMLLAIAGVIGIFNIKQGNKFSRYIYPFILLFFSSLIRFEAFLLILVLGFIYIALQKPAALKFAAFWKAIISLIFLIALSLCANKYSYSSTSWSAYYKYNQTRGKINDNPNLNSKTKKIIEKKYSIKSIELELFNSFLYTNSFNEQQMDKIVKEISQPYDVKMYIGHLYYWLNYYKYALFLVLLTFLTKEKINLKNILPIVYLFTIFLIICYNHLPKERVMIMLFFGLILFHLFLEENTKIFYHIICILGFFWMMDNYFKGINNIYRHCKNDYRQLSNSKIYITLFPIEYAYPNDIPPFNTSKYTAINTIASGWLNNSPFQKYQLDKLKLNSSLPVSLLDLKIDNDNIVYLGKMNRPNQTNLINTYLSLDNRELKLLETKSNFCLYSIKKNNP